MVIPQIASVDLHTRFFWASGKVDIEGDIEIPSLNILRSISSYCACLDILSNVKLTIPFKDYQIRKLLKFSCFGGPHFPSPLL